jgi:hypothetical protein
MQTEPLKRWYREPWPWILMAAPAAAVLAGAITIGLSVRSFDGLVAEDYYKQGLTVNQRLARLQAAEALGIAGTLRLESAAGGAIEVDLRAQRGVLPSTLRLTLSHPTRAGLDQSIRLVAAGADRYVGRVDALAPGRWQAAVEDEGGHWRIRGELKAPAVGSAVLRPGQGS